MALSSLVSSVWLVCVLSANGHFGSKEASKERNDIVVIFRVVNVSTKLVLKRWPLKFTVPERGSLSELGRDWGNCVCCGFRLEVDNSCR